jgi:hypothetical protein
MVSALCASLSGAFGIVCPLAGMCFIESFCTDAQSGPYGIPRRKVIRLLGKEWWQRMIPIQKRATALAWPGVSWEGEFP